MSLLAPRGPEVLLVDVGSNVPDRRQPVLVVTSTSLTIATIFVAARLVSRIGIVKRVSWDDYLIVVAWVCLYFAYVLTRRSSLASDLLTTGRAR
jgi:hypothetical protein